MELELPGQTKATDYCGDMTREGSEQTRRREFWKPLVVALCKRGTDLLDEAAHDAIKKSILDDLESRRVELENRQGCRNLRIRIDKSFWTLVAYILDFDYRYQYLQDGGDGEKYSVVGNLAEGGFFKQSLRVRLQSFIFEGAACARAINSDSYPLWRSALIESESSESKRKSIELALDAYQLLDVDLRIAHMLEVRRIFEEAKEKEKAKAKAEKAEKAAKAAKTGLQV